jgi:DNA polymerase-3 subunit epsilon
MGKKSPVFIAFDLETTGVDTQKDRIVQYCFIKMEHGKEWEVKTALVNPGIPIPEGASDVHGIKDEDVKKKHMFSAIAPHLLPWLQPEDAILMHFNGIGFDVPLLATEFERAGFKDHGLYDMKQIDGMVLYRNYRKHSLIAALKDLTGKDLEDAHEAKADVEATIEVIKALMSKQELTVDDAASESIPEDMVDFAGKLKLNDDGEPCYNIGKAKGTPVVEDKGFGEWMLKQDFPTETKKKVKELLNLK